MMITFGEPESVMNADILDYAETSLEDGVYQPPFDLDGFAKSLRANGTHSSALYAKRNILLASIQLNDLISKKEFSRFILDFLVFGNAYLQVVRDGLGRVIKLKHIPALYMRRAEKTGRYEYRTSTQEIKFKPGQIYHLAEYDVSQEIYGIPQYFAVLSSIWLNEDATLFRRKYYLNGAHSGFLLYMNNPNLTEDQENDIKRSLASAKGLGNFKNMFINGKGKDNEKPDLIPVSQLSAKDDFAAMKNVTRGDILEAHRIPPDLMSVIREGNQSSGDLNKIDKVFYKNEIIPLFELIEDINDFVNGDVITLKDYDPIDGSAA